MSKHAEGPREPTDCRLGEVHMPLQGQALKTADGEHPFCPIKKFSCLTPSTAGP